MPSDEYEHRVELEREYADMKRDAERYRAIRKAEAVGRIARSAGSYWLKRCGTASITKGFESYEELADALVKEGGYA